MYIILRTRWQTGVTSRHPGRSQLKYSLPTVPVLEPNGRQPEISRRQFNRHAVEGLAAAVVLAGINRLRAEPEPSEATFPKGRYLDMHTHLRQTWNGAEGLTAEDLLRWMDAHDVAQAVVLPLVSSESSSYSQASDVVLAQTKPYRDRLIPFCLVGPRASNWGGLPRLVKTLQRYVEAGAKGVGEHKPRAAIDDPRSLLIYEACSELQLPLLFHLDNAQNRDRPGLPGLAKALARAPACTFIGHGPGWWASISGDATQTDMGRYPKGAVSPGGAIDKLLDSFPNLYGDLSAGSGAGAIQRDLTFGGEFLIRRQDRIMFGTDYLSPGQGVPQFELFEKSLKLPEDVQRKISRDNARKVLGLA